MKKVLIVSNEEFPDRPELIPDFERFGFKGNRYNIPNLVESVNEVGSYALTVIHHTRIQDTDCSSFDRIILSGCFLSRALTETEMRQSYNDELNMIKTVKVPVLGICLGLQLICMAWDDNFSITRLPDGEFGIISVSKLSPCRILAGIGETFQCTALHRCNISHLPSSLKNCADSVLCPVHVTEHTTLPQWGTQFHPEIKTDRKNSGLLILKNFLE